MATPLARGLFHAAIGESGGGFGSRGGAKPKAEIETAGERFVEALLGEGVTPSLEALRSASADQVQAVASDRALSTATVDGWVFPDTVYNIFAAGRQHDVPVIVGSNADETSILGGAAGADTLEQYRESIRNEYGEHADAFFETFPANTDEQAQQARVASGTDATFGWEMRTWARMMETVSSPAYLYFFSRIPPAPDADRYGAYHTAEIPYVFDNFGVSPHPYANRDYTDTDRRLSDILASYWVNMAATGNPNSEGLPDWPAYDPEADAALHIGDTIGVEAGIRKERLDFFDRYYAAARRERLRPLEALRFAAGEGGQRLAEAQVADAHVDQELQAAPDDGASFPRILDRREEAEGVGDGHLQDVVNGAAAPGQLQDVVSVPPALSAPGRPGAESVDELRHQRALARPGDAGDARQHALRYPDREPWSRRRWSVTMR